jgi:hypothetical protein
MAYPAIEKTERREMICEIYDGMLWEEATGCVGEWLERHPECRGRLWIEKEYDYDWTNIVIMGIRNEDAKEKSTRLGIEKREREKAKAKKKKVEDRERIMYERLKKKFGE